jgi:protein gp37
VTGRSRIEWTEQTWNPVTGCTKISPGCKRCYAERMALRLRAMAAPGYARGFGLTLHEDRLGQPLRRNKPTVYFVCSMADRGGPGLLDKILPGLSGFLRAGLSR